MKKNQNTLTKSNLQILFGIFSVDKFCWHAEQKTFILCHHFMWWNMRLLIGTWHICFFSNNLFRAFWNWNLSDVKWCKVHVWIKFIHIPYGLLLLCKQIHVSRECSAWQIVLSSSFCTILFRCSDTYMYHVHMCASFR